MAGVYECPSCGSGNIADMLYYESYFYGYDFECYEMSCNECGAEWLLEYGDGEWYVQGDDDYEEEAW